MLENGIEQLTLQENAVANAMYQKIGDATVRFAIGEDGVRYHDNPVITDEQFDQLTDEFARNPKDSLAWARESLLAISTDERLDKEEKSERLDRYLDAYFDLTIKLDNAAFQATEPGEVRQGVPDYIPDGFVDMGGESELNPDFRGREQILIDKREVFDKYKPLMKNLFSRDYGDRPLQEKKKMMVSALGRELYSVMKYDDDLRDGAKDLGGKKVKLSSMDEGVCRHQGLVFQVLAQAAGLKTRVLKAYMDEERHSTNMLRLDGQWYIFDVTNPDYAIGGNGKKVWRPGAYKVDGPPPTRGTKKYDVKAKYSGREHTYVAHDNIYWHIETSGKRED